jgi:transposase
MEPFALTDAQWAKMAPHALGKDGAPGRSGTDNRLFIEAVLWVVRTGNSWRDIPESFGKWHSIYVRFRYWVKSDIFRRMFQAAADMPDMDYGIVEGRLVKLNQPEQDPKPGLKIKPQPTRKYTPPPAFRL